MSNRTAHRASAADLQNRKAMATSNNLAEARVELKFRQRKEKLDSRQARVEQQEAALDAIQARLTQEADRVRCGYGAAIGGALPSVVPADQASESHC